MALFTPLPWKDKNAVKLASHHKPKHARTNMLHEAGPDKDERRERKRTERAANASQAYKDTKAQKLNKTLD